MSEQPLLLWGGVGMSATAAFCAALIPFDRRTVTGINPWIKPIKFAVSIAIYYWTAAWLLHYVNTLPASRTIATATFWLLLYEMACIVVQAARGVRSHFNVATPFDAFLFATMGIAILANTGAATWLFWLFLTANTGLAGCYLLGIRLGLLLFILASAQGIMMVRRLGHAVGAPDDGRGLFFLNWSQRGGDLRVAHFLGLHAVQILPLCGYVLSLWVEEPMASTLVVAVAAIYALVVLLTLRQALRGRPLVAG